jgi:hypothetical protein
VAESFRLTVLKRLCALLELTEFEQESDTDLTGKVFRGRSLFGTESPKTMLSVIESTKPDFGIYVGEENKRVVPWALIIQGWTINDPENPTDGAYQLMAAVEFQLSKIVKRNSQGDPQYPDDYMLGPRSTSSMKRMITDARFGPGVVSPARDQVSSIAFFFMPIALSLVEEPGKPYYEG